MATKHFRASRATMTAPGWLFVLSAAVAMLSAPAARAEPATGVAAAADAQPIANAQSASSAEPATTQSAAENPVAVQPAAEQQPAKMVRLGFQGQEWLPVLEWLAKTRGLNLDWQKMPEGILNLSSSREYSVEEAEDLINMQLLVRGFTLLQRGEVLHVAPLESVDITMVPKVEAQELAKLPRHQYVRVTFPLKWMIAEEAANEFKPLISPYGKLFPMASANRLEAMDAVVNLRELHRLLTNSEADEGRRERVAVFPIKNRKAGEVAVQVRQLLGLPAAPEAPAAATQIQLDIEQAKYRTEAVKQLGTNAQPLLKDKPDVHLVVNDKENSILVNGRPDKIEIARQAIEAMDKPLPPSESPWESVNRVKVYEVGGFDPATITQLVETLKERGNLSKETRIQHEVTYNRLVVFASPADQVTIANVISGFRTQGRQAEVLQLSRIDPQYASKAIQLVLKNPARPSAAPGAARDGQFQIEPDVANQRLLLWATPDEVAEVRDFLAQLGENFADGPAGGQTGGSSAAKMHVVHLHGANAADVTKRLQRVWKDVSKSPLVIDSDGEEPATPATPQAAPVEGVEPADPAAGSGPHLDPMSDRVAIGPAALLVSLQQPATSPSPEQLAEQPAAAPAPTPAVPAPAVSPPTQPTPANVEEPMAVRVIAGEDGDVVIVSRDAVAAETAKKLVEHIVPTTDDIQVITLKHAQALRVKTQLDAMLLHTRDAYSSTLSTQKPLLIEADSRTNRLMIQYASPRQMRLVNEMIPLLDQPEQEDKRLVRQQRIYRVQRKRATEVAEVIKEVYRDLLSANDKVFAGRDANQMFGYNQAMAATSKNPEYLGLLAVGVDKEDNTLVLSAPAYLMEEVMELVKSVDASASGETVVVVPIKTAAARAKLNESLGRLLAKP